MENNKLVLSTEQMFELLTLNVDLSKASMQWYIKNGETCLSTRKDFFEYKIIHGEVGIIPAFTLQDIIDYVKSWTEYDFCVTYNQAFLFDLHNSDSTTPFRIETADNTIDAAFQLFKWCLKNSF